MITRSNIPSLMKANGRRIRRASGGMTTPDKVALGATAAVRPGKSPADESATGATLARRMKKGGYLNKELNDLKRDGDTPLVKLDKKRNKELEVPHMYYAKGDHVRKSLHSLYKMLHHHFEGGEEPKKASGGKLWIKDAINPKNKGALHKSLHVPKGQKIPLAKLHQAEHSKSPKLRKRAQLAETLRGLHHRPRGR